MAALSFSTVVVSDVIRLARLAHDPPAVRQVAGRPESVTRSLSVGGGYADTAALAKVGGAAWLTVPSTCQNGVPFDVTLSAAALKAGEYTETILATKDGFDPATCTVCLAVRPMGPAPKG